MLSTERGLRVPTVSASIVVILLLVSMMPYVHELILEKDSLILYCFLNVPLSSLVSHVYACPHELAYLLISGHDFCTGC